jgi:predicted Fe-S protein YdhL (DUF1289 family)
LHIADLEAAINHWRARMPADASSGALAPPVRALADLYGRMALTGARYWRAHAIPPAAWQAWLAWYATLPDAPCIAVCSTSQGDAVCKGCGRTDAEVALWPAMGPLQKRAVWRRITRQATALRFLRQAAAKQRQTG